MGRSSRNNKTFAIYTIAFMNDTYGGKVEVPTLVSSAYSCLFYPTSLSKSQLAKSAYGLSDSAQIFTAVGDVNKSIVNGCLYVEENGTAYTVRAVSTVRGAGTIEIGTMVILEKREKEFVNVGSS